MELPQRERLSQLVEELTTSGQLQLNQDKIKELKKICRASNDCIDHVYHSVMSQLNQEHAEIRLSAFQIVSELFSRSHHFRTLLVDNFQEFLELTVETDSEQPLPPPKEAARKLRSQAIQAIQSWQASYGSAYKKLALGYHFLKQVKKVDFQDAENRTVAERRREEERRSKMERIYRARAEAAAKEMEESSGDIEAALTEMESGMRLLFPEFSLTDFHTASGSKSDSKPDEGCPSDREEHGKEDEEEESRDETNSTGKVNRVGEITERKREESQSEDERLDHQDRRAEDEQVESEEEEECVDEGSFIRNSGIMSYTYSLDVSLSPVLHIKETEDNEPVVSTVMELHRLLTTKHLPAVQNWVQVFTKSHAEPQLLRRALDLRTSIEAALNKHKELHIDCKSRVRKVMKAASDGEDDDDEDDNDFDEVPEKEGYEPYIPEHLRAEYGLDPSPSTSSAPVTQQMLPIKKPAAPSLPSTSSSSSRHLRRLREEEQDPTSAAATLRILRQQIPLPPESSSPTSSESRSDKKACEAPVIPFGMDLYYWGQEQPSAGKITKYPTTHSYTRSPVDSGAGVGGPGPRGPLSSMFWMFLCSNTPDLNQWLITRLLQNMRTC